MQHRLVPRQAEPGKVFEDRGNELRPAPVRVNVFDSQKKPPAESIRQCLVDQRREGVAQM